MTRLGAIPLALACALEVRYPLIQEGYLSDTSAIPHENKAKRVRCPLCDTISKGYCAIWGISHWAAKGLLPWCEATNLGVFDLRHLDLLKRGLCKFGWVWSSLIFRKFLARRQRETRFFGEYDPVRMRASIAAFQRHLE